MTYITVDISNEARSALDDATRAEGVSASAIVDRAVKRHLFARRFRELREETLEHMRDVGLGDLTTRTCFAWFREYPAGHERADCRVRIAGKPAATLLEHFQKCPWPERWIVM